MYILVIFCHLTWKKKNTCNDDKITDSDISSNHKLTAYMYSYKIFVPVIHQTVSGWH